MEREPCLKCGLYISTKTGVSMKTIMRLSKVPLEEYVRIIVEADGVSIEVAEDFVNHRMGHFCAKTKPPCPICRASLITWHATGCWTCGWRRDPNKHLPEYYASNGLDP